MRTMAAAPASARAEVATPVESGTLEVAADVVLTVEVAPRWRDAAPLTCASRPGASAPRR